MKKERFLKEREKIEMQSIEEQKAFYQYWLEKEQEKSDIRLLAYFYYARLFYQDGDFRKAREILEPFVIDYQSYSYIPEMISCFNLMGVACHCEAEYVLTRYFYNVAQKIAEKEGETHYFSYEYNNIALTYIAEENFEEALQNIYLAEQYLPQSDAEMGAYVYLNMSIIYYNLNRLDESLQAFKTCIEQYEGEKIIPDDVLLCGVVLFYKLGEKDTYEEYKNQVLQGLEQMYAAEFIDACKALFECGLDSEDYDLVEKIIASMNSYMSKYPTEIKVGVNVEELKYIFAKKRGDQGAMLDALERKNMYNERIIKASEKRRTQTFDQFLKINKELQNVVESKEKANMVKTQFLANMSHDMRTPINGIMGMLNIIRKNREDTERVNDCLDKIDLSSEHLLSLVNDVLDMTKLETESVMLEQEPFELDQVCAEATKIVTFQAREAGLRVYEEHDDVRGIHLLGSPLHLKKILINLFSNSIKYNKPGGAIYTRMRILNRTEDTIVCEFRIRDTGVGMTKEFIENKLFEPFMQEREAARSTYEGTGLGMTIVGNVVEKMGGSIEVESKPDEGTCFTVVLPFEIDQEPEKEKVIMNREEDLRGIHLLVVEDNELNMEIVEFLLTEEGATIDKAQNGLEALQYYKKAESGTYDAVLMDLMMPVMDGYEAARKIRESGQMDAETIPIIAMSATAFAEDVRACLDVGMNAHMSKPLFREEMIETILKFTKKVQ